MAWPTEVPVVEPQQCYKGDFVSPDGRAHCALGWLRKAFTAHVNYSEYDRARDIAAGLLDVMIFQIDSWNDKPRTRHTEIAQLVNRTTAILGYTEGNPEAAFARKWWKEHGKPREADL